MSTTQEFDQLCSAFLPVVRDFLETSDSSSSPVTYKTPTELKDLLKIELSDQPTALSDLKTHVELILNYTLKTRHKFSMKQLYSGSDLIGTFADFVATVANTCVHIYRVSPAFSMIEVSMVKKFCSLVGFSESDSDGLFCPGGSSSNLNALVLARNTLFPETKKFGFRDQIPFVFCSDQAHYSICQTCNIMGIGSNHVIKIPTDTLGCMIPKDFEESLERVTNESPNNRPFAVVLTAGTTVLGGFDPIEPITLIARKYKMWVHVDASWGGTCLLSNRYRILMSGIEDVDSVVWNPHKGMGVPLQCSLLLVRNGSLLHQSNSVDAPYLFQPGPESLYDLGSKSLQCSRKNDALKLYLSWMYYGKNFYQSRIEKHFESSRLFLEVIRKNPNFELVVDKPMFLNICFWFLPPEWRSLDFKSRNSRLNSITNEIGDILAISGSLLINYQPCKGLPCFFRYCISGIRDDELDDLEQVLRKIEVVGFEILNAKHSSFSQNS